MERADNQPFFQPHATGAVVREHPQLTDAGSAAQFGEHQWFQSRAAFIEEGEAALIKTHEHMRAVPLCESQGEPRRRLPRKALPRHAPPEEDTLRGDREHALAVGTHPGVALSVKGERGDVERPLCRWQQRVSIAHGKVRVQRDHANTADAQPKCSVRCARDHLVPCCLFKQGARIGWKRNAIASSVPEPTASIGEHQPAVVQLKNVLNTLIAFYG